MATPSLNSQTDSQTRSQTRSRTDSQSNVMPKLSPAWRVAGWVGLVSLLALGFMGYFLPSIRLNWDAIAAMCGF